MSSIVTKETINMTQPSACTYFSKKPKNKKQMQLFVPTQDGVAKMDVMVADFLQHNTLPLSLTYCTLFTGMIQPKHYVHLYYVSPNRHIIVGPLLGSNFGTVRESQNIQLNQDKTIFRLSFYGVSVSLQYYYYYYFFILLLTFLSMSCLRMEKRILHTR